MGWAGRSMREQARPRWFGSELDPQRRPRPLHVEDVRTTGDEPLAQAFGRLQPRVCGERLAVDAKDEIAGPQAGALGRKARQERRDLERAGSGSEPRAGALRRGGQYGEEARVSV